MGYYINWDSNGNTLPTTGKAKALIADGARSISSSEGYQPNLVCVVHNDVFEAAVYVFDEHEFMDFIRPNDRRVKQWLVYEHAAKLSGYDKRA